MKSRTTLTIKGKVQKVGFRSFVEEKAKEMGITGYASNLVDKSVLVVCEGEQTKISKLIDSIGRGPFNIDNIQKSQGEATGEFNTFKRMGEDVPQEDATLGDVIKVLKSFDGKAKQLVQMQRETKEEIKKGNKELGGKIDNLGDNLGNKIETLGDKVDIVGVKIDSLGEKTESFHQDMSCQFSMLDDKYGIMAQMVKQAVDGIKETNKNTEKILERIEKQQEAHNQLIEKLIKAMINKSGK